MFFSKVLLFAVSLGALSVLATPHALHPHAFHRRALAARVASAHNTNVTVAGKRQNSSKCNHSPQAPPSASSSAPSSNIPAPSSAPSPNIPAPSPIISAPSANVPAPSSSAPSPIIPVHSTTVNVPQPPATTSDPLPTSTGSTTSRITGGNPVIIPGTTNKGDGTYYATGLGACGITNTDSQHIVAVSELLFDTYPGYNGVNPNTNPVCGKTVIITGPNGKTDTGIVTDRCTGCQMVDIDMTTSLFTEFSPIEAGRIKISWHFHN